MVYEQCENCGFDASLLSDEELLSALDNLGPAWREHLVDAASHLRTRPAPQVWSAVEYAAHSRDITALHLFGVREALTGREMDFGELPSDELMTETARPYNDLTVEEILTTLSSDAVSMAGIARDAGVGTWENGLRVGGQRQTVRQLLAHALHDSRHHLVDIERNLVLLRATL